MASVPSVDATQSDSATQVTVDSSMSALSVSGSHRPQDEDRTGAAMGTAYDSAGRRNIDDPSSGSTSVMMHLEGARAGRVTTDVDRAARDGGGDRGLKKNGVKVEGSGFVKLFPEGAAGPSSIQGSGEDALWARLESVMASKQCRVMQVLEEFGIAPDAQPDSQQLEEHIWRVVQGETTWQEAADLV